MYKTNNNENINTTTTESISSSSTTTRTHAHASEAQINVAVEGLRDLYQRSIGQPMSEICESSLRRDLAKGTPYVFYHYALIQAAYAPRPSWRYVLAIIRRLQLQGVTENQMTQLLMLQDDL